MEIPPDSLPHVISNHFYNKANQSTNHYDFDNVELHDAKNNVLLVSRFLVKAWNDDKQHDVNSIKTE